MRLPLKICLAGLLQTTAAFGWGCEGHQMLALIARAHLTPAVSAAVDQLLRDNPVTVPQKRYCEDRPTDLMADIAAWPDDVKNIDKNGTWHYVDIPVSVRRNDVSGSDLSKWCPPIGPSVNGKDRPGCLTAAIDFEWAILRDKTKSGAERANALRYIIHFLGDLSQPLHDTDNHDQGGNCTRMLFFDETAETNLHSLWDHKLFEKDRRDRAETQVQYAADVDREFAKQWPAWGEENPNFTEWAWQGHDVAASVVYGKLKPQLPAAVPTAGDADKVACDALKLQTAAMHIQIGAEYYSEALPVARQQLAKGGYRLADVLNRSF